MSMNRVTAESCSPKCLTPAYVNDAGVGTTWTCPRCGARWEMTDVGSLGEPRRVARWRMLAEGTQRRQKETEAANTRWAWGCCSVIAGIAIIWMIVLAVTILVN